MEQLKCIFCDIESIKDFIIFDSKYFYVKMDDFPVRKGHVLIFPKRHQTDIFSLDANEWGDLQKVINKTKRHLDKEYMPDGYNIGINCGEAAGQTVFHLHIHVIPRYKGDVENPRGGIRNFLKPLVEYPEDN